MSAREPLRVLIVDDEALGRTRISDLLARETDVEVVAEAADGAQAIAAIRSERPDVVFLDIQMPGRTGLDVVAEVGPERMPATVFVTAYDQHAIKAFEVAAVDYLVKPFDDERFAQALSRVRETVRLKQVAAITGRLLSAIGATPAAPAAGPRPTYLQRIPVESRGQTRFVPVEEIDYVSASGPYAELHAGGKAHLIRERMQALEERLDPERFFRIHRSAIVQLDRIESLRRRNGDVAVHLKTGEELPVARNRREELERKLAAGQ
jgi:two-component system, LytTR family, response regulator